MIYITGEVPDKCKKIIMKTFIEQGLEVEFKDCTQLTNGRIISISKKATEFLNCKKISFYNWDLLFSNLGPNDVESDIEEKLIERIRILKSIIDVKSRFVGEELHGSIRVVDLARSTKFYTWLFGVEPKEWTHRYVTFVRPDTKFSFVLLVSDGKDLNHDTLYHLGMGVSSKDKVIECYHSGLENGFYIEKPPRTTWRGTPLHELWLKDPDGTLIEIYSRLTAKDYEAMPDDKEPTYLT